MNTLKIDGIRDGRAPKMQSLKIVQHQTGAFKTPTLLTIEWE